MAIYKQVQIIMHYFYTRFLPLPLAKLCREVLILQIFQEVQILQIFFAIYIINC